MSLFLTTLYQQDIESGQEQLILLVVMGVVTGSDGGR
jgi:ABC-type enterochelin transport system permease subunit